jgi:hypothetical protein
MVTVLATRVVKMASDAIIHVLPMRHHLVTATGAVQVACFMPTRSSVAPTRW